MPKTLKLLLEPIKPPNIVWYRRPIGTLDSLPAIRVIARANFMRVLMPGPGVGKYAITNCIVDTGSFFSIIAEDLWRRFIPGYVTPLPFDPLTPRSLRTVTIAGGRFPYELGELTIRLEDQNRTVMPVTVIAKLTRDGGRLPIPITLGLRGGFLEGRTLHAEPDAATPFGQAWTLTSP